MSATVPAPPQSDDPTSTARYLEDLAVRLMLAHNNSTEPEPKALMLTHMAPDFRMLDDSPHNCPFPPSQNLDSHLHNVAQHYANHPDFEIRIQNVTAEVEPDGFRAIVWLTEAGSSSEEDKMFNRESVSRLFFRWRERDGGRWVWYKHHSLRGSGDFF